MKTTKTTACLVTHDDEQGTCCPMGWDTDCEGALMCSSTPVIFTNRAAARKAINISKAFYKLCKEQGVIVNDDFSPEAIKNVRIVSVEFAP